MALDDSTYVPKKNTFISISRKKEGYMGYNKKVGNNKIWTPVKSVSGFVESFTRKWDDGDQTAKIKPHFQYVLVLADGQDSYTIPLSEHLVHTNDTLNRLYNVRTDQKIALQCMGIKGDYVLITLVQNNNAIVGKFTEWDIETQTLVGIPPVDKSRPNAHDHSARNQFWFDQFKTVFYPKFNGGLEWSEEAATPTEDTPANTDFHKDLEEDKKNTAAPTVPATDMFATILKKIMATPAIEYIKKWVPISNLINAQVTAQAITPTQADELCDFVQESYNRGRNKPYYLFFLDGNVRLEEEFLDDLPF